MSGQPEPNSDEALAEKARNGDLVAFETLCDRYLPVVYNRLRAKLPAEVVEDVTQEVFVAATRSIRRFRGDASFRTWISTIARYKIADYYRARERRPQTVLLDPELGGEGVENPGPGGLVARDRWEERQLVRIALRRLPDHYQEVLLLRFAEGLKFKNVAREIGISLEAAKSRYRRAVKALAEEIERT